MGKKERLKELVLEDTNPITGTKIESVIWDINVPDSGAFLEVETELGNFYFSKLTREIFLKEKVKPAMITIALEDCDELNEFFDLIQDENDFKLTGRIIDTPEEFKTIGVPSNYTLILLKKHIKKLLKKLRKGSL